MLKPQCRFALSCLMLCALCAACSRRSLHPGESAPSNSLRPDSHTLVYSDIDEPRRLDPAFIKDLYEGRISGMIYDGLVEFGKGSDVVPGLADHWEMAPDGTMYTFHLRPAQFADGRAVTSADVRYSFTRLLRPETNSDRKWVLNRIEGADRVSSGTAHDLSGLDTPNSATVVLHLKNPYPVFLKMLAMPNASVIPKDAAGSEKPDLQFDQKPMGSGPWILKSWKRDQFIELERNPYYWGGGPQFDRLAYRITVDESTRRRDFEAGNTDIYQVGFSIYDAWARDPARSKQMVELQELRTDFLGFMNNKQKLQDPRIRKAIASAVDLRSIFDKVQKRRGRIAHGPVPPGIEGYRSDFQPRAFEPAAAKKQLEQLGAYPLEIALWFRAEAQNEEVASIARDGMQQAGIKVTLMPRDLATLRSGVNNGDPDMYLGSWTLDYPDIENALVPPFHSRNIPRQGNGSHFSSPAVDQLLEAAESEQDPKLRIEKYQKAEDAIIDQCPWIPLFHRAVTYAVNPRVHDWKPALIYNADRFNDVILTR